MRAGLPGGEREHDGERMRQVVDIARKLELTSIALGCLTRKELCAAFARVNPNTAMTLQNCYNWQSGRSAPRNFGLFEDWAAALGLAAGPHFVMSSSLEAFARVLGERFSLPEAMLDTYGLAPAPPGEPAAAWRNGALLRGSFAALSHAWSPMQRGRLLCGVITIDTDGSGGVSASYRENVLGETIAFDGSGLEDGKTAQVALRCAANGTTFLMAFHLPPVPGNLAGGVFAGNALYDPNAEPVACPLLLLRNHALTPAELDGLAGYEDLSESVLADCLSNLGYGSDPELAAERELLGLLAGGDAVPLVSVPREALGRTAMLLDQRRLQAAGRA